MSNQTKILNKLERQLIKIIALLAKTEQQANLAFCEKEAKTLTVIIKALENIRGMQLVENDQQAKQGGLELQYESDQTFRDEIAQKLAAINQNAN